MLWSRAQSLRAQVATPSPALSANPLTTHHDAASWPYAVILVAVAVGVVGVVAFLRRPKWSPHTRVVAAESLTVAIALAISIPSVIDAKLVGFVLAMACLVFIVLSTLNAEDKRAKEKEVAQRKHENERAEDKQRFYEAEEKRRAEHAELVAHLKSSEVPASYTATATELDTATAHRREAEAISGSAATNQASQTVKARGVVGFDASASIITKPQIASRAAEFAERLLRYLEQQQYALLLASIIPGQTTSKEAMDQKTLEKENETLLVFKNEFRDEADWVVRYLGDVGVDVSAVKRKLEAGPKSFADIREIAVGISEGAATLANQEPPK
jgi:Ca2+/Na+ antiporter